MVFFFWICFVVAVVVAVAVIYIKLDFFASAIRSVFTEAASVNAVSRNCLYQYIFVE